MANKILDVNVCVPSVIMYLLIFLENLLPELTENISEHQFNPNELQNDINSKKTSKLDSSE